MFIRLSNAPSQVPLIIPRLDPSKKVAEEGNGSMVLVMVGLNGV
jgi:hypothetical protein